MKMADEYFVLYKKDFNGKSIKENKAKRELYDKINEFNSLENAKAFAFEYLHQQPILARQGVSYDANFDIKNVDSPYIVAARFDHKYFHYDYGGGSDAISSHEVMRCQKNDLEKVVNNLVKEQPDRIIVGIELKLF